MVNVDRSGGLVGIKMKTILILEEDIASAHLSWNPNEQSTSN
jgi:hypothetical protein